MAKLTHKSQQGRKPKCRDCFVDMSLQLRLMLEDKPDNLHNADWKCPKCGREWLFYMEVKK